MSKTGERQIIERRRRWPAFVERMVDIAVLPGDRASLVTVKRLFTTAVWVSIPTSLVSIYQLYTVDAPAAALVVSVPLLTSLAALVAISTRPGTYPGVMHLVAAGTLITTTAMIVMLGGVFEAAGNSGWGLLVVVGGAAVFADRRAHFWLAVYVVGTIAASFVAQQVEPLYVLPNRGYLAMFNLLVVGVFVYGVLYYFVRQSSHLYQQSEGLLRNILPGDVVERLKRDDEMIADEYASASILFADVADFTPLAARLEPEGVINLLNDVFTDFDALVAERGLEKIKTIGDAYMVASGVPTPRDDHATAICDLALAMCDLLLSRTYGGQTIQMRVGIASGPVMAGIIGTQKFSYDLWGDTVNVASRMESTGTAGRIQITPSTHALVESFFEFEERGLVDVKGKGRIQTWYLTGRMPT